jgi:hypothetical protein
MFAHGEIEKKIMTRILSNESSRMLETQKVMHYLDNCKTYNRNVFNLLRHRGNVDFVMTTYNDDHLKIIPVISSLSDFMDDLQTKYIARVSENLSILNFKERLLYISGRNCYKTYFEKIRKKFMTMNNSLRNKDMCLNLINEYKLFIERIDKHVKVDSGVLIKNEEEFFSEITEMFSKIFKTKPKAITKGIKVPEERMDLLNYTFTCGNISFAN